MSGPAVLGLYFRVKNDAPDMYRVYTFMYYYKIRVLVEFVRVGIGITVEILRFFIFPTPPSKVFYDRILW